MANPYAKEKESCVLCKLGIRPDYKNVKLLSQFISPYTGYVYPRNITRLCYYQQEHVVAEIGRARSVGQFSPPKWNLMGSGGLLEATPRVKIYEFAVKAS
jgi:ribosomal protein S18